MRRGQVGNQVFQATGDFLDRYLGVDPMLIEQVDVIGFEPFEHTHHCDLDVLRTAVQARAALSRLRVDVPTPGAPLLEPVSAR